MVCVFQNVKCVWAVFGAEMMTSDVDNDYKALENYILKIQVGPYLGCDVLSL